jgi:nucleotide-binding universal stress UspA family protein
MKKILVPMDFGKPAINALEFALDIADKSVGTVQMVHVVELPVMNGTLLMPTLNFEEEMLRSLGENARKSFANLIARYKNRHIEIGSEILYGHVTSRTLDYIDSKHIDLVVMGSHGSEGIREFFAGSNTQKIVRSASVPVLVLKENYKGPIENIVFPVTFEVEEQDGLIDHIKGLQKFFDAYVHLVRVNTPINFTSDTITHKKLDEFARRYEFKNFTTAIFNSEETEAGIVDYTNFVHGDLIAMGTHGRTGIDRVLKGSMTEGLVNHYKGLVWTFGYKNQPALVA